MPTIKEISKAAGVSPSTVSIVLRGKAEERSISKATQIKVLEEARNLGYQLNVSARRLRSGAKESLVISVFWASDFRAQMMARFLNGLQNGVLKYGKPCEIIIHPYQNDMLYRSLSQLEMCNAAIICNASDTDMKFLHSEDFNPNPNVPIVLYNRASSKFCTVNIDDCLMGSMAADIFHARKHKHVALLATEAIFPGITFRIDGFTRRAEEYGLSVNLIHQNNSMAGGYQGGLAICDMIPLPDCVFCLSDAMAIGALRAFNQNKVHVPEDIEIICIGNNNPEWDEYASVSLSAIQLPMEKMAEACIEQVFNVLEGKTEAPYSINMSVSYIERESCGRI